MALQAAVLKYENNVMNIRQFNCSPHPYWLPNFMDVFTWSLPFVAEKITDLFLVLLRLTGDEVDELAIGQRVCSDRREVMRAKLRAISRVAAVYARVREKNEVFMDLKESGGRSRRGSLLGEDFKRTRRLSLDEIKELDKQNECLPKASVSASQLV